MTPAGKPVAVVLLAALGVLPACSMFGRGSPDNAPTLKSLEGRSVAVEVAIKIALQYCQTTAFGDIYSIDGQFALIYISGSNI